MYLTRFDINPARRGAQRLLGSPQAMHAAVLASFPPASSSPQEPETTPPAGLPRTLWRLDRTGKTVAQLYIVSLSTPDLTHLVEQAGWPTTQTWQSRDYTPLLDRLDQGQRWGFRLKANPVHGVRLKEGKRSQPLGHVTVDQQQNWLMSRVEKHGFTIAKGEHGDPDIVVHSRETQRFLRQGQTVTLTTATYDGILEITDAEALRAALTTGIGRAKGYGCGMLTLAPV